MKTYQNFTVSTDHRQVTTVTLDVPGRAVNTLDHGVMAELDQIVQDLEHSVRIKLVVFQSGKESGFLAGADVNAIAGIDSASEAIRVIEAGQMLFQRIQGLSMPSIAVIHGPCLGGGLELALACTYRVARDNSSTQIGLPEIKLGLIPGWGGTQRLPRIVGVSNALSMILTGKHLSGSAAWAIGLVDRAIDPEHWQGGLESFIDDALHDRVGQSWLRRPWWQRAIEATRLGRAIIAQLAARRVARLRKDYPALAAAIAAVRRSDRGPTAGYLCERDEFVALLATPTCRHLLDLFFARQRARSLTTWSAAVGPAVHETPIRTVGVVGAGAMGAGIGQLAAVRGYHVVIKEIDQAAAAAGQRRIAQLIDELARRKGWDARRCGALLDKISIRCDDSALAGCDLVIEAVVELADVKAKVFAQLDRIVQPSAILASNTSSLRIADMAAATARPTQVAGLHFFNPVHRMELVEVVRAAQTDEATIGRLITFVQALGKTPIVTSDTPGFLVNRVLFPYLGEAVLMVAEGHDVQAIDSQVRRFGMPMGPLQLLDQVGLDVALHVASSLDQILPDVSLVIDKLAAMVNCGQLGKKSGLGFYRYRGGDRGKPVRPPFVRLGVASADPGNDSLHDGLTSIARRLIYPMLAEAVRCHQTGVVREPWAIDLAMVLGTGFAPHRGGPLHVIDAMGPRQVVQNLYRLRDRRGDRFTPPRELIEMAHFGQRFFSKQDPARFDPVASA